MQCSAPDCAHSLGQADIAAGCCQNCYDTLDATQIEGLRIKLGIKTYAPPEIIIPEKQEDNISLPVFEVCGGCSADLMDDTLLAWKQGTPCPYCQEPSRHQGITASTDASSNEEILNEQQSLSFILNSGPNIGAIFSLPIGVELGRNDLRQVLSMPEYDEKRGYISSEQFKLHMDEATNSVSIEDLGSKNGTYINGAKIVGPIPKQLFPGDVLNLHDISLCLGSLSPQSVRVTHKPSGVVTEHPISETPLRLHLGRFNSEGGREAWFRMAQVEFNENQDILDSFETISRRHLFLEFERKEDQLSVSIWNEKDKIPFEVLGLENLTLTSSQMFTQSLEPSELKSMIFTHGKNSFEVSYVPDKFSS